MPTPPRRDEPELLDTPELVAADIPANLADIRRMNRWFGGTSAALRSVEALSHGLPRFRLLDVATGSADIPAAIARRASERGVDVDAVGLDSSLSVLAQARILPHRSVGLIQGDARALPFEDSSFDIVTCCLALHHFPSSQAVQVLREMWRVASRAVVVSDLRRGYLAYLGTVLATRTVASNRVTRHDGPLSVLRAYTPAELRLLADEAGLQRVRLHSHAFFRIVLVGEK